MVEASRIMPNIYYLGFKSGQAFQYLSNVLLSGDKQDGYPHHLGDDTANHTTNMDSSDSNTLFQDVLQQIYHFPALYSHWWWNLVKNDPIHVLVETTLILSILYILIARSKDWRETEEFLSPQEEEELLREWKLRGRAPLTPQQQQQSSNTSNSIKKKQRRVVVHKVHGPWMDVSVGDSATTTKTSSKANNNKTSTTATAGALTRSKKKQLQQAQTTTTTDTNVRTILNFATYDYLGMCSNQPTVRKAADQALNTYGCGSCGPRGFYGTIDAHLQLEQAYAEFLKVDGAILYSDGASTCASTIAAFAKRGDLIVADEGIYEPLRTGVSLSRAHVKWFKHNDMQDLRRLLTQIQAHDQKVKRPLNAQRRFLVVEGLYKQTGTIVPLKELVQLKHEFSYRLILDESNSFGCLGKTGRGVHELYDCPLMHDVEITTIALENGMGAIGGITVGSDEVVEHQRLSGSGYCFSASSPPFTATAAIQSLELLQTNKETTLQPLQDNVAYLHHKLTQLCHVTLEDVLLVTSAPESPILFLQVADIPETRDLDELLFLEEVVQECLMHGVTTSNNKKSTTSIPNEFSSMACVVESSPPGIRITVTASHTHEHLDHCLRIFSESVEVVLNRSQ
mmetsp:Transcript_4249/g.8910  ORF Transcript_4249/g.8910 Transcript_4249/m.8910 type:complete len:623 (-) Transcript_4249:113-1981(-)